MPTELASAFQALLFAVVVAVFTLMAFAVKKLTVIGQLYLEQKLGQTAYGFLKEFVTTTVHFLEQQPAFKDLTGEEKKNRAIGEIVSWCQSKGIPIDPPLIDKLIEEAVNLMNGPKIEAVTLDTVK